MSIKMGSLKPASLITDQIWVKYFPQELNLKSGCSRAKISLNRKYRIRFNKSRGQPGRGTVEHVWRVLQGDTEWLAKHVIIEVPSRSEQEGPDWNIVCEGAVLFFEDADIVVIK